LKIVHAGLVALATLLMTQGASAQSRIEVGQLSCNVEGGAGFIFGSTKNVACTFEKTSGQVEYYGGQINKWGLDLGATRRTYVSWLVLASTTEIPPGALAGTYGGVSAEASIGVGVGANALIGGSARSYVLQPLSVQAQEGLNIAAGIAQLNLYTQ